MTDREKAIIMAYTGTAMLTGEKFSIFHKYIEDILGRPVWTHELASHSVMEEIKEKSKSDFIELCKNEETRECMTMQLNFNKEDMKEICDRIVDQIRNGELQLVEGPKAEWNPLPDGRPVGKGYYLTTTIHHEVYSDYWNGENFERTEDVIAWMPLPEPYKSEVQDEDS